MKKNFWATTVTIFSFIVIVQVASAFADVPPSHPYAKSIDFLVQEEIIDDFDYRLRDLYHPNDPINRAEFTKILIASRFSGSEIENCTTQPFQDTPPDAWLTKYVCVAQKEGIIHGYGDGNFYPEKSITLPEAAKIIAKTYNPELVEGAGEEWFMPYFEYLAGHEALLVMKNVGWAIDRAEAAVMIAAMEGEKNSEATINSDDFQYFNTYQRFIPGDPTLEITSDAIGPKIFRKKIWGDGDRLSFYAPITKTAPSTYKFIVGDPGVDVTRNMYRFEVVTFDDSAHIENFEENPYIILESAEKNDKTFQIVWSGKDFTLEYISEGDKKVIDELTLYTTTPILSEDGKYGTAELWTFHGIVNLLYNLEEGEKIVIPKIQ